MKFESIKEKVNKFLNHPMRYRKPISDPQFILVATFWSAFAITLFIWAMLHPPQGMDAVQFEKHYHPTPVGKFY